MGAIKIKSCSAAQRSPILIKRKRNSSEDGSAIVSLQLVKGNKKITQSRKMYNTMIPKDAHEKEVISIHLEKLNEEFLGLKKAYIFDEISMDIKVNNARTEIVGRKKIILTRKP